MAYIGQPPFQDFTSVPTNIRSRTSPQSLSQNFPYPRLNLRQPAIN